MSDDSFNWLIPVVLILSALVAVSAYRIGQLEERVKWLRWQCGDDDDPGEEPIEDDEPENVVVIGRKQVR